MKDTNGAEAIEKTHHHHTPADGENIVNWNATNIHCIHALAHTHTHTTSKINVVVVNLFDSVYTWYYSRRLQRQHSCIVCSCSCSRSTLANVQAPQLCVHSAQTAIHWLRRRNVVIYSIICPLFRFARNVFASVCDELTSPANIEIKHVAAQNCPEYRKFVESSVGNYSGWSCFVRCMIVRLGGPTRKKKRPTKPISIN